MSDPVLYRYRVTFAETGRLAMLSHLELTHALERMIRRAGLPFAVTQGFSPHMKIGYGAALPVGVGGTAEVFDLFLTRDVAPDAVLERLVAASPACLRPTHVARLSARAAAASVAYPFSLYEAQLELPSAAGGEGGERGEDAEGEGAADAPKFAVPEVITFAREGKSKELAVANYLVGSPWVVAQQGNVVSVRFLLRVLQTGSLRPDVFLSHTLETSGIDATVRTLTRVGQWETAEEAFSC